MNIEVLKSNASYLLPMFAEVGGGLRMGMREEYADALEAILRAVAAGTVETRKPGGPATDVLVIGAQGGGDG